MKIKKSALIFVSIVILFNIALMIFYFGFFIYPNIKEETIKFQDKINNNVIELVDNFKDNESVLDAIKKYQRNHSSSLYIEDEEGKVIYNNADIWDIRSNYYISRLVNIDGTSYLIKLFEPGSADIFKSMNSFALFEIFVVCVIISILFLVTRFKLLKPIENIQTSIKNYKFGIRPKKNKEKTELDLIQNEFVDLVDSLEDEKNNQRRIISSISHDIRTPITSVLGYSEMLNNSKVDKKTRDKYINIIYRKALSLKELSDEFEDYLYQNNNYINLEKITLFYLKEKLELDFKIDLSNKNIDLKVNFKNLNDEIYIDINKMKRVFSNIIGNSVRYMTDGGIIEISGNKLNNFYQFEISDNGSGTKEDLQKIFDPLFTTDKSRKVSGLGLSICKEIIELHGGIISAYNNDLGGLTIRFTIRNNII